VVSVDEKTAILALDRQDPGLPLSPGRVDRHGVEYFRHGTRSLYAAFHTKPGEVSGKTSARHTSAEGVAFLANSVAHQPTGKAIHGIADHLSAHKPPRGHAFLPEHPHVQLPFPPSSSGLHQVERWRATIQRDVIARGVFTSGSDLKRKRLRSSRHDNR
jgi:hypothetical protein